jgi:GNAT superfamily N-acetyltransferase
MSLGMEDMCLMVRFNLDVWCGNPEPHRFISAYHGEVFIDEDSIGVDGDVDSDEPSIKVGEIDLCLVDRTGILNEHESLFEAMDMSFETFQYYEALIDEHTHDWKEEVADLVGENALSCHNILLIKRLELAKRFRGQGIGREVVQEVIQRFGSTCAVIICKPFPLQYSGCKTPENEQEQKAPLYKRTRREAFAMVASFWKKMGFWKLPSSDHYVWVKKPSRRRRSRLHN